MQGIHRKLVTTTTSIDINTALLAISACGTTSAVHALGVLTLRTPIKINTAHIVISAWGSTWPAILLLLLLVLWVIELLLELSLVLWLIHPVPQSRRLLLYRRETSTLTTRA